MELTTITANGVTLINTDHSASGTILYTSGTVGTATFELIDPTTNETLVDGVLEIGKQYRINHGAGKHIGVRVSGAGGTSVELQGAPI